MASDRHRRGHLLLLMYRSPNEYTSLTAMQSRCADGCSVVPLIQAATKPEDLSLQRLLGFGKSRRILALFTNSFMMLAMESIKPPLSSTSRRSDQHCRLH